MQTGIVWGPTLLDKNDHARDEGGIDKQQFISSRLTAGRTGILRNDNRTLFELGCRWPNRWAVGFNGLIVGRVFGSDSTWDPVRDRSSANALEVLVQDLALAIGQQPTLLYQTSNGGSCLLLFNHQHFGVGLVQKVIFDRDLDEGLLGIQFLLIQNLCHLFNRQQVLANGHGGQ